jgi:site-specific DNA recombinase
MHNGSPMRFGIYARFSSDLQRNTSITDQFRTCREYGEARGWTPVEKHIVADEALSAATLAGREALNRLLAAAKSNPRPFDCILIEDTSRLARNIEDALRTTAIFKFHGVSVIFVTQGIDSQSSNSRQLLTLHGMMDEQFLVSLADKVHRGQEGRALQGLNVGGRCYGYRNVPIEDSMRMGKYGRPAVIGVRMEIDPIESKVVLRIFQMSADGYSLAQIAKTLNAEGVPSPRLSKGRKFQAWATSSIREMLYNERYRGVQVWNRTKKQRNPETGRKVSRPRPESEWQRTEVAEWRIVPEDLWQRVHAGLSHRKSRFGAKNFTGVSKSSTSKYLFSGLMVCGVCGANLVIVSGDGMRAAKKYGCPNHRYRGICSNKLMIRQDVLEPQLIRHLEEKLLTPQKAGVVAARFEKELEKALRMQEIERQKNSSEAKQRA